MLGTMLLHYRILTLLGQGVLGEVYLAQDTRLNREVAIKVLPEAVRRDPLRLKRFKIEAEAAARLNHPNIAQIYAIEDTDGVLFIVMEYVDGQPLSAHIPPGGLTLQQFFDWFVPLADALAYAHEHGVTHYDLKPGNIMISKKGIPKMMDFGLARILRPERVVADSDAPTKSVEPEGVVSVPDLVKGGTPAYMSPEQAEEKLCDHRTDVFSFGVVLYEVLTGRRPFRGETPGSLVGRILTEEPALVTVVKPGLPREVGRIVRKCLQKVPERRYQMALEVRNDLEEVQREVEAGTVIIGTAAPRAGVPAVLRRWPVLAAAATLLLVIGALAIWFLKPSPTPPLRKFPLPVEGAGGVWPATSPDGKRVAYVQGNRLWIRHLDRVDPQEIPDSDGASQPFWSPQSDVVGYFAGGTRRWRCMAALSPDGRYVAYTSNEPGRWEVYVTPFPKSQGRWPVSVNGGVHPRWNGRGDELFYVEGNTLMAVKVDTRSGFSAGLPQKLFTGEQVRGELSIYTTGVTGAKVIPGFSQYDVTADGQRFVVVQRVGQGTATITVVEQWWREFKKQ